MKTSRVYQAFISYSHAADGNLAPALQSALQRFAKPWYRLRAIRLFRDKTSLSLTPELWPSIERALLESEYFILLASPAAAASNWVKQEISAWLEKDPGARRLLIVLTEGEVVWNRETRDFDWAGTDALPTLLSGRFQNEPLYSDLRWVKRKDQASLRHGNFSAEVAEISATLRGIPKDDLVGEDVHEHRRVKILAWSAIVLLLALTVSAVTFAVTAVRQSNISIARQLAAQSQMVRSQTPNEPERAVLLAIESQRRSASLEGDQALRLSLSLLARRIAVLSSSGQANAARFSLSGGLFAAAYGDGKARLWETRGWRELRSFDHTGAVLNVAIDESRGRVATSGMDGRACVWETTGRRLFCVSHAAPLSFLSFGHGGRLLLTATADLPLTPTRDFCARVWDAESGKELAALCHEKALVGAAFVGSDGPVVTASKDGTLLMWEQHAFRELHRFRSGPPLTTMAVSEGGKLLAAATWDQAFVWDVASRKLLRQFPADWPQDLAFVTLPSQIPGNSRPSEFLLSANASLTAQVWELGRPTAHSVELPSPVSRIAANPRYPYFATGTDNGLTCLWSGMFMPRLAARMTDGQTFGVTSLSFSPDGERLVTAKDNGFVAVWPGRETSNPEIQQTQPIDTLQFLSGGDTLLTAGGKDVVLWNWHQDPPARYRAFPQPDDITAAAASPDGLVVATASVNGPVSLWGSTPMKRLPVSATVRSLAFSPDGRLLAAGCENGMALVWLVAAGAQTAQLAHTRPVGEVAFSSSGRFLATATRFEPARLWRLDALREGPKLLGSGEVYTLSFSPDGRYLAGGLRHSAAIWEVPSGKQTASFPADIVTRVAFSSDGGHLAVVTDDQSYGRPISLAQIWDLHTHKEAVRIEDEQLVKDVRFAPDGKHLAVTSYGGSLRLVSWRTQVLIDQACGRLARNLTPAEWGRYLPGESYRTTCPNLPPGR